MSEVHTFACDICSIQKGENNHWYKGVIWKQADKNSCVSIYLWEAKNLPGGIAHLCGLEHAMKWAGMEVQKISEEQAQRNISAPAEPAARIEVVA